DGNGFLDFVTLENMDVVKASFTQVDVIICAPGAPQASCSVNNFVVNADVQNLGTSVTTADFDGDGLDDLAFAQIYDGSDEGLDTGTKVQVHLNQDGGFDATPDQTLTLNPDEILPENYVVQVIAKDIDACGGPDLAYIGISQDTQKKLSFSKLQSLEAVKNGELAPSALQAAVAFNANETPVADAGNGTSARVGGDPTCTDPTGDAMTIQWTVIQGSAAISDATAANPTITNASADAVLQVTCTDSCGAAASDTVTLSGGGLIEGAGCALSTGTTTASGFALLAGLFLALPLLRLRRGE
ncbi:MAG: hypothetical protein K8R69_06580, partial [Deltaproteobacteria bacterium]|nr:hypothetical protein [Deltaproteobacteria bacterium]